MPAKASQRSPFHAYLTAAAPGEDFAQARLLPRDLIDPNPWQPRRHADPERLAELAADITVRGIVQPLVVRPVAEGRYEIIAGERRYRAAGLADLDLLPCVIREVSDAEARAISLVENLQREDLDIEDEARYLKDLHDSGLSLRDIGELIHKSYQYVNRRVKLAADPAALLAYREGQLNLNELIADRSTPAESVAMDEVGVAARAVATTVTGGNSGGGGEEVRFVRSTVTYKPLQKLQVQIRRLQRATIPETEKADLHKAVLSLLTDLSHLETQLRGTADVSE